MEMTPSQEKKLEELQNYYNGVIPAIHIRDIFLDVLSFIEKENPPKAYPDPHPTELKYPVQTEGFREMLDKMYQLHLVKNQDYSPSNINGTGMIGLATRLWDKTVRIMNLLGFNIEAKLISYDAAREPKNESLEDTFVDLSNYGVIGRLMMLGKWGK
jgi:DNA polymerase sigma